MLSCLRTAPCYVINHNGNVQRYKELSRSTLHSEISAGEKTLLIFLYQFLR